MPMDDKQVAKMADNLRNFWNGRNEKFEAWYKLREMRDERKRPNQLSIALNDARVFLDLAIHMLSHRPPRIRVPVLGESDPEQETAGRAELFLAGVQRQINQDRYRMGLEPWQRALADFMCSTGWWAVENQVLKNPDGTPLFISDVLDPAQVYPQYGHRETRALAHIYPTTLATVQSKARDLSWDGDFSGDGNAEAEIQSVWWIEDDDEGEVVVFNSVLIGQREHRGKTSSLITARPPAPVEGLDRIPIRTGPVAGWSVRSSRPGDRTAQARYGESILEAGAPIYDMKNEFATIILRKAQDTVEPTTKLRSRSGRWTVAEDDLRSGVAIPLATDQDIEYGIKPPLTADVGNLVMPLLEQGVQRAGASDLFLGAVRPADLAGAGFALSLMEPHMLSKLVPFAMMMEMVGAERDSSFVETFRDGDFKPVRLSSRNDGNRGVRRVFFNEWKPADMPEHSVVNWEIKIAMPDDSRQRIVTARQAKPDGDLLDIDTLLEDYIQVDDVDRVKKGIRRAVLMRDPAVAAVEAVMEMENYAAELRADAIEFAQAGDDATADARLGAAVRVERLIEQRIQAMEGGPARGGPEQGPPGLEPETFGTQAVRDLAAPLTAAQGIPGVGAQ